MADPPSADRRSEADRRPEADRRAAALAAFSEGRTPPNVALMHLLAESRSPADAADALAAVRAEASGAARERFDALAALLDAHPDAWATVRSVLAEADHEGAAAGNTPERWAAVFDRLAAISPEAGVALYALGSADLLDAAGREVVGRVREWGLTGPGRHLLEIGCGYGRLALMLAGDFATVTGLDVSGAMVAEARRRAAGRPGLRFDVTAGRDLSGIPDASIDLVLAPDVFPYLVGAGLADTHVRDAARVLRPGGVLLILNYSYRGDLGMDRADLAALAVESGLVVERDGTADFALWDARTFLLRRADG